MTAKIVKLLSSVWRNLTQKALRQSSGKLETAFFESVYRITYASGFALSQQGWFYLIYSSIVKLSVILFISSELWYLFGVSSNLDAVIDNINVTIIHLIVLYRYKIMTDHKLIYRNLAMSMESAPRFDVSTHNRKRILNYWINRSNRYYRLLLLLGTLTLSIWYVYPLIDSVEYNFTAAVRLPFFYQSPELYPKAYALVLLMFHFISYFVVINDLILQAHLLHMLCQFDILADSFENVLNECVMSYKGSSDAELFVNEIFVQKYIERFGRLVEQHQFILSNAANLRKILSTPMLGQLAASMMLICLVGYQITATITDNIAKFIMSILYLCYNMFVLYVFCRWCEEIKIKSSSIRDAIYCSGWERGIGAPGVRLRLLLVAARASRPVVITAGGLYDISLMSYTTLVKTSYSALTILLRARHHTNK